MKKMILKHSLLAGVAVFSFAVALPVVATAQSARALEAQEQAQTNATERKEAAQTRLADAKLKACENRQKAITNIMSRIADRGQKQLTLFNTIAERTQSFYTDKGKTLANYDELVADVAAKKATAQSAVDAVTSSSTTFDCSGEDPKGVVNSFKDSLKSEIEALKAYRTAVKNLIIGVKSVQGATSSAENGAEQ
jgi:hypothetical protein